MRGNFQTKGPVAQWRVIYAEIKDYQTGQVITHQRIRELLPDVPEGSLASAWQRALKEVEEANSFTFRPIMGVGYERVHARENVLLARKKQKSADRALTKAVRKLDAADTAVLTADERKERDRVRMHLATQRSMLRQIGRKEEEKATPIAPVQAAAIPAQRTDQDRLAAIEAQLSRVLPLLEDAGTKVIGRG